MPVIDEPRYCECGAFIGRLVEIEYNGAAVYGLQIGGVLVLDMSLAICASCGRNVYHHLGMQRLLAFIRSTGRQVSEADLSKPPNG